MSGQVFFEGSSLTIQNSTLVLSRKLSSSKQNEYFSLKINSSDYLIDHLKLIANGSFQIEVAEAIRQSGLNRTYTGELEIGYDKKFNLINILPVEQYVYMVAYSELGPALLKKDNITSAIPQELLEAMRIVVRSYLLHNLGRHNDDDYDLCDLTHCMHFPGINLYNKNLLRNRIEPFVLVGDRKIIDAFFHSTCGGRLSSPESYWPGRIHRSENQLYRSGPDEVDGFILCQGSPHFKWATRVPRDTFLQLLSDIEPEFKVAGLLQNFPEISVIYHQNRVSKIKIFSMDKIFQVPIAQFMSHAGRTYGWNVIKSNLFSYSIDGKYISIQGRGLGHGIGLCQWGARELARRGWKAKEILQFYYPGAKLIRAISR